MWILMTIVEIAFWEDLSRRPRWDDTLNYRRLSVVCVVLGLPLLFLGHRALGIGCLVLSALADTIVILWVRHADKKPSRRAESSRENHRQPP